MWDSDHAPQGPNHYVARLVIEELVRGGVEIFCIAPGSRSTPLVVAAAEHPQAQTFVHFDERGAGFFALGVGRATGKPAALICTSGTAVANYYPAVIEASVGMTPLIVLSADRPFELLDTGANQTIEQNKIFSDYLRWQYSIPAQAGTIQAGAILTGVSQALFRASNSPAGAVQINLHFRKPLLNATEGMEAFQVADDISKWQATSAPRTRYSVAEAHLEETGVQAVSQLVEGSKQGLIVAGQLPSSRDNAIIRDLAAHLEMPIIADCISGLRCSGVRRQHNHLIVHSGLYLDLEEFGDYTPDLILHFGGTPVSAPVNDYLNRSQAEYLLINDHPFRQDPQRQVTQRFCMQPHAFCKPLLERTFNHGVSKLLPHLLRCDSVVRDVLGGAPTREDISAKQVVCEVAEGLRAGEGLFLANSLAVREADLYFPATEQKLLIGCNRGVSGIDGTIASAVGFARGLKQRTGVILGDIAFLHDLNSLAMLQHLSVPMLIVVINNGGCGIFSMLPVKDQTEYFDEFFKMPHGLSFEKFCQAFGVQYRCPNTATVLRDVISEAVSGDQHCVIEIITGDEQELEVLEQVKAKIKHGLHSFV
ncbi:2-succinyl-5-enolpyruvyl-6-hydroxy-3-cyclohexene-1-carboxylic-acid synthase [Oligoflexia bacterium]|nr:2-succinyl-5-enolpyruvyl-6-hydroxy-3-cyclohexene-1-carboxylic-acid synthase [Oligoflexia bacterium]